MQLISGSQKQCSADGNAVRIIVYLFACCLTALSAQIGYIMPQKCDVYHVGPGEQHKYRAVTHNKPTQYKVLFGLGFMEMIPSPRLGFLRGVFLANHLASNGMVY